VGAGAGAGKGSWSWEAITVYKNERSFVKFLLIFGAEN